VRAGSRAIRHKRARHPASSREDRGAITTIADRSTKKGPTRIRVSPRVGVEAARAALDRGVI
jgi:hypothetical protein